MLEKVGGEVVGDDLAQRPGLIRPTRARHAARTLLESLCRFSSFCEVINDYSCWRRYLVFGHGALLELSKPIPQLTHSCIRWPWFRDGWFPSRPVMEFPSLAIPHP